MVPELSDLTKGLISVASPIGKGILGGGEGDELEVVIPSGTKRYELLKFRTIHDRE